MQGANQVNDDFEVGYNEDFERRWYVAELVGRVFMITFVGVALTGLLGRGPFSHARLASSDGMLQVDYEPVARSNTPTTVTMHIRNPGPTARHVVVHVDNQLIEPMGFQRSTPIPQSSDVVGGGMELEFVIAPEQPDALIRFGLQPITLGLTELHASIGGASSVDWKMVVLP